MNDTDFDCVEMMHESQRKVLEEFAAAYAKHPISFIDWVNQSLRADPWASQFLGLPDAESYLDCVQTKRDAQRKLIEDYVQTHGRNATWDDYLAELRKEDPFVAEVEKRQSIKTRSVAESPAEYEAPEHGGS